MGLSKSAIGVVCTIGACLGLAAVLAASLTVLPVPLDIAGALLVTFGWPIASVPGSMRIGLTGGASASAFTVHTIVQAGWPPAQWR